MKAIRYIGFLFVAFMLNFGMIEGQEAEADSVNVEEADSATVEAADSTRMDLRVTLITCDPGPDAYQMFGHTAVRVQDLNNPDYDLVYNYGVFDSRRNNFIYYFVKGETDYVLSVNHADQFIGRYRDHFGIQMYEQELELTPAEKDTLTRLLEVNARPENRTYRYNFLYDNCTTRAIHIIEKAVEQCGGQLVYQEHDAQYEETTFRDILHRFTAVTPWMEFGIDFVLGSEVDKKRDYKEQMFIPSVYESELDAATISDGSGVTRKIVGKKDTIAPTAEQSKTGSFPLSPLATFTIVLVFTFILCVFDLKRGKLSLWADIFGLFVRGLAGFLVAFLFFFSEHPAVGSNWLVLAFNPLFFIMIPDVIYTVSQKRYMAKVTIRGLKYDLFELVNLSVLIFTLLLFVLPIQSLHIAMLPLVLTLLIRSVTRIIVLNSIASLNFKKSRRVDK